MITIVAEDNTLAAGKAPLERSAFHPQNRARQIASRWIAPAVPRVLPDDGPNTRHSALHWRRVPPPYSNSPACSAKEMIFLGLLSAAALLAIGYGFWCGMGLAGNWEQFQAGIAKLIQA
ncbi:MAG TPA: hypothetical protein VFE51_10620 [Verrucomicrobiae bacterium]|nr:hypothetical protein [Verrucomicrobiae bacterium]